jgi:regulator of replication initiation timing
MDQQSQQARVTVTIDQLNLEASLSATLAQRSGMIVQLIGQLEQTQGQNVALQAQVDTLKKRLAETQPTQGAAEPEHRV